MIKHEKLPNNIMELLPEAAKYLQSHPQVVFAYLFGRLAAGKPEPMSDVDIAVYLNQGLRTAEYKFEILGELIDILQTDEIDLVVLNSAKLPLIMNIIKSKKVMVDKAPFKRHIFESLIMRKYFDFSIKESSILYRRYMNG